MAANLPVLKVLNGTSFPFSMQTIPVLLVDPDGNYVAGGGAGGATTGNVTVTNTVAVSAAALPLPTGAATAASQPALHADGGSLVHVQNMLATDASNRRVVVPPSGSGTDASVSAPAVGNQLAALTVATPGAYFIQNQSAVTLQVVFDSGSGTPSIMLLAPGNGAGQQGADTSPAMTWFTGRIRVCGPANSQFMARSN